MFQAKDTQPDRNAVPGLSFLGMLMLILAVNLFPTNLAIKDYRHHLNRNFEKKQRLSTRYIIIHTSEAGLVSTLRTLSKGKRVGSYRTKGGHSHYVIARDGKVFRILDHQYRADHTGLSMWDGIEDISSHSLGIELVGFHYGSITQDQYASLAKLLPILQRIYSIPDRNILSHCQVAYGRPNLWFRRPHRGRKRCARNFDRFKAGLNSAWTFDPDVRSRRLSADPQINTLFYGARMQRMLAQNSTKAVVKPAVSIPLKDSDIAKSEVSNIISATNTAWTIAGEDFNSSETIYIFPNGKKVRGDKIAAGKGWHRLPPGTQVMVNSPKELERQTGPVFTITGDYTAWSFAGANFQMPSTFYFFPNGRILPGDLMRDWDSLPDNTKLIVGYKGPYIIENKPGRTPWGVAGKSFQSPETVYFIPGKGPMGGDRVKDFNDLPAGSRIFLKKK